MRGLASLKALREKSMPASFAVRFTSRANSSKHSTEVKRSPLRMILDSTYCT